MKSKLVETLKRDKDTGAALLLEQYGGMLHYIARGILQDASDTEECVSDICMRVCDRIEQYDEQKGSFSSWLTAVARNTALNALRKQRRDESLHESMTTDNTPEKELLHQEMCQKLQQEINQLSDSEKALFYRKFYYMQSTAQIAAELGLSERSVEGRIYRLRQKLQKRLGGEWG